MNTRSERLKEERKRLGHSQEAFAQLGGVKKRAQINYENGDRKPDAAYFAALGAAGVDVRYVVTGQRVTQEELELERRLSHVRDATSAATAIPGLDAGQQAAVQAAVFQARMAPLPPDEQQLLGDYRRADPAVRPAILAAAAALAGGPATKANAAEARQIIHGDVGQITHAEGDIRNKKQVFNVGTRKKK